MQGGPSLQIVELRLLLSMFHFPAQLLLPTSHQPKQIQAEGGTGKIKVNPTQLSEQMDHPVFTERGRPVIR